MSTNPAFDDPNAEGKRTEAQNESTVLNSMTGSSQASNKKMKTLKLLENPEARTKDAAIIILQASIHRHLCKLQDCPGGFFNSDCPIVIQHLRSITNAHVATVFLTWDDFLKQENAWKQCGGFGRLHTFQTLEKMVREGLASQPEVVEKVAGSRRDSLRAKVLGELAGYGLAACKGDITLY